MELRFNEQDIVDSVCVYMSVRENVKLEQVEVDLEFTPSLGYSASALSAGRTVRLYEQDLIDAVAVYLRDYHEFNPDLYRLIYLFLKKKVLPLLFK